MANSNWHNLKMHVKKTGPTTAECSCTCGYRFAVEAIEELNLLFDDTVMRLRAICPRCGKLESVEKDSDWGGKPPAKNRIDEFP